MTSIVNSENQGKVTYNELEPQDDYTRDVYPLYSKGKWILRGGSVYYLANFMDFKM